MSDEHERPGAWAPSTGEPVTDSDDPGGTLPSRPAIQSR